MWCTTNGNRLLSTRSYWVKQYASNCYKDQHWILHHQQQCNNVGEKWEMAQWAITGQRIRRIKYTQLLQLLFRVSGGRWSARMHLVLDRRTNDSDVGYLHRDREWHLTACILAWRSTTTGRGPIYQPSELSKHAYEVPCIGGEQDRWRLWWMEDADKTNDAPCKTDSPYNSFGMVPGQEFLASSHNLGISFLPRNVPLMHTHKSLRCQHLLLSTPVWYIKKL